jgi:hypothetical protein
MRTCPFQVSELVRQFLDLVDDGLHHRVALGLVPVHTRHRHGKLDAAIRERNSGAEFRISPSLLSATFKTMAPYQSLYGGQFKLSCVAIGGLGAEDRSRKFETYQNGHFSPP